MVYALGFRVYGVGASGQGVGFGVQGFGVRGTGLWFRV
jgi:hypothetical protein